MLVFDNMSWHYKLILYSWGENFFLDTSEIDWKKLESIPGDNIKNMSWIEFPKISKPKTVNLCPYLRALVGSIIALPFVWLYRKFPRIPHKPRTHIEVMKSMERRSIILRYGLAALNIGLGLWRLLDGEYGMAAFQIGIGLFIIFIKPISRFMIRVMAYLPKRKHKKQLTPKEPKEPSLLKAKIAAEHDKICPPIFFIDKKTNEASLK